MRRVPIALLALLIAAESGAQVIRRGSLGATPPSVWLSGMAAATQGWRVTDGATSSVWDFGNGVQYGASIERAYSGFSVGLRGNTALLPLVYQGTSAAGPPVRADADARVSQLLASAHVSGGRGLHTVLEVDAGATNYSGFRARTGEALRPDSDTDFTFSFGYGAGFGFSNRFTVEFVQDLTTILHQRTGLDGAQDTNARMHSTRLVGRLGLGQRR